MAHVPPLCISDTRYVSDLPPSFIRHTQFISSHITIYQTHAPFRALHSYHYLHAFVARPHAPLFTRFSLSTHTLHTPLKSGSNSNTSNNIDVDGNLHPSSARRLYHTGANITTCKPCQLSAVSGQLSAVVHFAQGSTPLERLQRS